MNHATRRAMERYGIRVSGEDFAEIRKQITDGNALKIRKTTKKMAVYDVVVQGRVCRVAYHRGDGRVRTFLPREDDKPCAAV